MLVIQIIFFFNMDRPRLNPLTSICSHHLLGCCVGCNSIFNRGHGVLSTEVADAGVPSAVGSSINSPSSLMFDQDHSY
jgi:hypothetical protein